MKSKHYLMSLVIAVLLVLISQSIVVKPGSASCLNGASNCARDDYFDKYGWPFAFKSVSVIKDVNRFAEYSPLKLALDILIAFIVIDIIALLIIKFKRPKQSSVNL
ncbi:MAG: hypothetical protein KW804_00080 [Candidatus Doudnabacteria bacterium]|nr:hypothetical protein [Candidatus Doudnabacteria bacterium]